MSAHAPIARVNKAHENKKALIEKVKALATSELWIDRFGKREGFNGISNSKLLRLHKILESVKSRFGSRDKLIDALVTAENRSKDADYRKHFADWSLPRLVDALASAERRSKRAGAATKTEKKPVEKKAADKKPAAAKAKK